MRGISFVYSSYVLYTTTHHQAFLKCLGSGVKGSGVKGSGVKGSGVKGSGVKGSGVKVKI